LPSEFGLEYLFRWGYFAYRFRAFRAMIRLCENYFKIVECLMGLRVFDGHGKRALDVRCTLSMSTRWLASLGCEVAGLDVRFLLGLAHTQSIL
jgi:2-polyprenyl-3-methyl-5-hydroxy-6-metoxy-1,4-benzoquinol methylase